jgi:hypothetical protein
MSKPDSRRATGRAGSKATTRRAELSPEDRAALARQSSEERKAKSQLVLFGSIGGGVLLLIIIIVAASSSGAGASTDRRAEKKKIAAPPPEPPKEKSRPVNYVRNTGAIVFVCGGSDKHADQEVVVGQCPACKAKNAFEVDGEARAYRCTKCKAIHENAAITCDLCGRSPRVTHLKKVVAGPQ